MFLLLAFVRCSAPSTCVRNSDCMDGEMCVNGGCFPLNGDPTATSSIVTDDASVATGNDAGSDASVSTTTSDDAATAAD